MSTLKAEILIRVYTFDFSLKLEKRKWWIPPLRKKCLGFSSVEKKNLGFYAAECLGFFSRLTLGFLLFYNKIQQK